MMGLICDWFGHKEGLYMGMGKVMVNAPIAHNDEEKMAEFLIPGQWHVYKCARCPEIFSSPKHEVGVSKDLMV